MAIKCFLSFILCLYVKSTYSIIQAYTGVDPVSTTSPLFKVKLIQGDTILYPHVYYSKNNNSYVKKETYQNRSVSWIEFGQQIDDTTTIEVSILNGIPLFNNEKYPIRILPLSYNITDILISHNNTIATFKVYGNLKHMSLEYGNNDNGSENSNNSSFKHSMLIFIGDLSPSVNKTDPNTLYFGPGVHNITNKDARSILKFDKKTIYIDRGAWVKGKINISGGNGIVNIHGYGILDGSAFNWEQRDENTIDGASMLSFSGNGRNRAVNYNGLTIFNPSKYSSDDLPDHSIANAYRVIAWYFNNDGGGCRSYCSFNNSFIRTNDNSFRIHLAKYGYILVENIVFWQLYNGSPFQLGWNGPGCINSIFKNCDIIHAEWTGYDSDENGNANGAIIGMIQAKNGIYTNLTFDNLRIDTHIGRVIGLDYHDIDNGGQINGLKLSNFNIREPFQYFIKSNSPENFLSIDNCSDLTFMKNISFLNIIVNGTKIKSNTDWNLKIHGNISTINYS